MQRAAAFNMHPARRQALAGFLASDARDGGGHDPLVLDPAILCIATWQQARHPEMNRLDAASLALESCRSTHCGKLVTLLTSFPSAGLATCCHPSFPRSSRRYPPRERQPASHPSGAAWPGWGGARGGCCPPAARPSAAQRSTRRRGLRAAAGEPVLVHQCHGCPRPAQPLQIGSLHVPWCCQCLRCCQRA